MGVKKSTRAKTSGKATAKRLREKAVGLKAKMAPTRAMGAGLAFAGVVIVAGVVMFAGRDSGERAEAAVAAQVDSPAPAPAKPVRAIAGVPRKSTTPKAGPADAQRSPGAPKTASELPDAVTMEGCLEQTGDTFRLKDTAGDDAPKSRSWKSGFLKKGAKPVEIVDWNNRLKNHVGERVSVSGMFVDGEMHVRSLRRVSATCN